MGQPYRTRLAAAPALRKAGAGHEVVALEQGGFAVRRIPESEKEPAEPKPLSVGITPSATEPVSVKDGVVHIGKDPALNFDTGEPVKVSAGAKDAEIRKALRDAGALSRKQKLFGGEPEAPEPKAQVEPTEKWRTNFIAAAQEARAAGIDPKGRKLAELVSMIDEARERGQAGEAEKGEPKPVTPQVAPAKVETLTAGEYKPGQKVSYAGRTWTVNGVAHTGKYATIRTADGGPFMQVRAEIAQAAVEVSKNTVFTDDAAAAARAILKKKLGTLNAGLDPEMLQAGITLAGYHIEKGARTFAAYAKAMVDDLGDAVRPHLKSWYMALKYDPRASDFAHEMDDEAAMKAPEPEAKAEEVPKPAAVRALTDHLGEAIADGKMPKDNPALRKMVEQFDGKPATPERMKQAQEALEAAIVKVSRGVVEKREGQKSTFDALLRVYESQPNLNSRSSTSIENQAYSTPAPLAWVASELADITKKTTTLEPTAGNGMLLIGADPKNTIVNELNGDRLAALQAQGFKPTQEDATKAELAPAKSVDRVIANPPFGPIKNPAGESIKVKFDGYTLGQIDHLIAARALEAMKDDGKATLIIGANKAAGQRSNNDLVFFNWLYGNYRVSSHFEVDGDLYQRQGAGWPVRVITIDGRQQSGLTAPQPGTILRAYTWSDVYDRFQQGLDAQRGAQPGAGRAEPRLQADDAGSVPGVVQGQAQSADHGGPEGGAGGNADVQRERAGPVVDLPADTSAGLGERSDAVGSNDQPPGPVEHEGLPGATAAAKPARNTGSDRLEPVDNQFQTTYVPRSSRKDEGVLIPVNMAGPTQDALNRLEDKVGDIDKFARKELGYKSVGEMHDALMGLQVDSVASAIDQIKSGKAVIIADQTGIGKGRQAAAIIRWAAKNDKTPVFITAKPSLFTDMFGDLHDIGTDDIAPFILNKDESIKGAGNEKLFANRPGLHRAAIERIAQTGELPDGRNAVFMTYSQINTDNAQRRAVLALAPKAVIILDEAHNASGDSGTGKFITDALGLAHGVTYLSATYAKRPDNMPLYFKTDIGEAIADESGLMEAMKAGGLPLQTVVSNNLVKAGQMFRRERSYDGVNITSRADVEHRDDHVKMSDAATSALRAITAADRMFHESYVKSLQKELEKQGEKAIDAAGNQVKQSVDHTQFSSVVHNFVRQMLLGLKAQEAASEAVRSIKRGEKPLIAVENTMGSFLNEYADANGLKPGDQLGNFDYRTVLSRALERSRYVLRQLANGDKVKEYVPLSKLDPLSRQAYEKAQSVIDALKIDIPVSPIDWMRSEITKAGHTVAEVTGRNLSVDYSDPENPKLSHVDPLEQSDKVRTTRRFNDGSLDSLILNVAGSTGISLHASEKFADQRQRHMIVAQPAQDINIFMQMLGRVHRTGQVRLPKYTLLNADLPAEIRPTAVLSAKMKSLNANTSSNTESATSVRAVDMLNKYGDAVVQQYLADNPDLARALDLVSNDVDHEHGPEEDIARKATGRLALMPVKVQEQFYAEVEDQYRSLIDYLDKTNQNELEPRTFDFDAKETKSATLFEGQNKESPFGQDAVYGEYSVKAQGKPMTPDEVRAQLAEHLAGKTPEQHAADLFEKLRGAEGDLFTREQDPEALEKSRATLGRAQRFVEDHKIGDMFRVEINGEAHNAVITNLQNTHKSTGNPYSLSKFKVTVAVNGALRSLTVPATQFDKIETGRLESRYGMTLDNAFKEGATNDRETAKIVTGNLLGAYGEMEGTRGSIISFTKGDGSTDQGILLPKSFNFDKDTRQDYRLKSGEDAFKYLTQGENENLGRFGINSRDQVVRVLPAGDDAILIQVPKSKAQGGKFFLDPKLRAVTGDFFSVGNTMRVRVEGKAKAAEALDMLMQKQALYALPSMAEEARKIVGDSATPSLSRKTEPFYSALSREVDNIPAKAQLGMGWRAGMAPKDVNDAIAPAVKRLDVPFKLHQSVEAMRKASGYDDIPDNAKGMHFKGQIHLVAENLHSPLDAQETLWHEIEHAGIGRTLRQGTADYEKAMRAISLQNPNVRAAAKDWMTRFGQDDYKARLADGMKPDEAMKRTKLQAVEEALAQLSGSNADIKGSAKFIAAIQKIMRSVGLDKLADWIEKQTDATALSMILEHRASVLKGAEKEPQGVMAPAFSHTNRGQPKAEKLDTASYSRALDAASEGLDRLKEGVGAKPGGTLHSIYDGLLLATQPDKRSDAATNMAQQLRWAMGIANSRKMSDRAALNKAAATATKAVTLAQKARDLLTSGLTKADKLFIGNKERGWAFMQAMDSDDKSLFEREPQLKPVADVMARMWGERAQTVQELDTGALQNLRENYFRHMWKQEPDADTQRQIFSTLSKSGFGRAPGSFKTRFYDDFRAGVEAGLKPVSDNPLDIFALSMHELDKYIIAHSVLKNLEGTNGVHLIAAGEKTPKGYTDVNGRFGNIERDGQKLRYVARDDVAQVVNNYTSQSLYHNKYVGGAFTAYMHAANTLNQFQLGVFSAFHAGFTSMEAVISHAAVGIKAASEGDWKGAAKYMGSAPAAWITNPKLGDKILGEWLSKGSHPEVAHIIGALEMAGARFDMDTRFRTDFTKNMLTAWADGKKFKAGLNSIGAVAEQSARPILEWLVPRQKAGVFGEMWNRWTEQNPAATHEQMLASAQQIWNRVDSRLGQVVYDRLFVHNVAKNFAQMLIRAPGWTGGTILEVGGGIKDLATWAAGLGKAAALGQKPAPLTDRAAYTLSMLLVTATANALLTSLFTGQAPADWKDLVAFRTGNIDEHGRPERFMLPTYMKDVYAYSNAPGTTLVNKSHPLLSLIGDVVRNRDFYGTEIRSEDAGLLTQLAQTAGFGAKAFVPFWIKGVQKEQEREGSALAQIAPLGGVMPAPSGMDKTAAEQLISKYAADRVPQGSRTQEESEKADLTRRMYVALRRGEPDKAKELFDQGREQGLFGQRDYLRVLHNARKDPLVNSFGHLTYEQAQRVMKVASEDEKRELTPLMLKKRMAWQRQHQGAAE